MFRLKDNLCLETVLHFVGIIIWQGNLLVDIRYIGLQLQVMLVEVVGDGTLYLGIEVIGHVPVRVHIGITGCQPRDVSE